MSVQFKDYYEILSLERNAAAEEVRSAYRRLAFLHHPDRNPEDAEADGRFREIQEAYDVLGDPVKRRQYDLLGQGYRSGMDFQVPAGWGSGATGPPPVREPAGPAPRTGFSEFFEALFGGGARARETVRRAPYGADSQPLNGTRGGDLEVVLPVTLEEVHEAAQKRVNVQIQSTCAACQGSGFVAGSRCGACEGHGIAPRSRTIEIRLPPGVRDGARLRLAGQGEASPGGLPGDIQVRIRVQPHPVFAVDGNHVIVELPVAPWEAVLGGEVDVPTLDGMVKMKLPPGTQNGAKMRLQQRGLRTGEGRGDEIVRIKVLVPTEITERERHLFRQLRDISRFRPRIKDRSAH